MANSNISSNLTEVTTPRQAKNGTRMFYDNVSNCCYGSYASGYVRRSYVVLKISPRKIGPAHLNCINGMYPLNKKIAIGDSVCTSYACILVSNESDRIEMINKAADRGWRYKGSYLR